MHKQGSKIAKLTSSVERKLYVGLLLPAKTHQRVLYFTITETRKGCMAMINQSVIELIKQTEHASIPTK